MDNGEGGNRDLLFHPHGRTHDLVVEALNPPAMMRHGDKACAPLVLRAKEHFARSDAIMAASPRRAVRTPRVMAAAYRSMLDAMVARGWRAPRAPVRLRKWQLIRIVLRHAII